MMPVKYINEPWKTPMAMQRAAGSPIANDQFSVVDHKIALKRCSPQPQDSNVHVVLAYSTTGYVPAVSTVAQDHLNKQY